MKPETREKMMELLMNVFIHESRAFTDVVRLEVPIYLSDLDGRPEEADDYRKEVADIDEELGEIRKSLRSLKELILDECKEGE